MAVRADSANKQFDSSGGSNFSLVIFALLFEVRSVSVKDVDVIRVNVNVLKSCNHAITGHQRPVQAFDHILTLNRLWNMK